MRKTLSVVALLAAFLMAAPMVAHAQAATVSFDYSVAASVPATVQGWTARLYVNGVAFTLADTCVAVAAPIIVTCNAALPNISTALPPTGPSQFQVSLQDGILEGPKSVVPLVLSAPSAPSTPRIQ